MGVRRALVIGSDGEFCRQLAECFDGSGITAKVVLDYNEGLERLVYEKPDLAVIERVSGDLDKSVLKRVEESDVFEIAEYRYGVFDTDRRPVLTIQNENDLPLLMGYVHRYFETAYSGISFPNFALRGELRGLYFPRLLIDLYRAGDTGVLTIESRVKLKIYLKDGFPVCAEGGEFETALGRIFLDRGIITEEVYQSAVEKGIGSGRKIGHVLVQMGSISPHELNTILEEQAREKILSGFSYVRGFFSFEPLAELPKSMITYRVSPLEILMEGIRRHVGLVRLEHIFQLDKPDPIKIHINSEKKRELDQSPLVARELRFIHILKEGMNVEEVLACSMLDRFDTLRMLYFTYLVGYLSIPEVEEIESTFWTTVTDSLKRAEGGQQSELSQPGGHDEKGDTSYEANFVMVDEDVRVDDRAASGLSFQGIDAEGDNGAVTRGDAKSAFEVVAPHLSAQTGVGAESPDGIAPGSKDISKERLGEEIDEIMSFSNEFKEGASRSSVEHETAGQGSGESSKAGSKGTEKSIRREIMEEISGLRAEGRVSNGERLSTAGFKAGAAGAGNGSEVGAEKVSPQKREELIKAIAELHATLENRNHYEILGLDAGATQERVKEAYFLLAKKFHPDRARFLDAEWREKAEQIFVRVSKAYEILSNPKTREIYDTTGDEEEAKDQVRDLVQAETAFNEGETFIKSKEYELAIGRFQRAYDISPDEADYLAYLSWAKFLAARDKDAVFSELRTDMKKAISLNPTCCRAHYFLGIMYKYENDVKRAEESFLSALDCDSDFIQAKRELWLLRKRRDGDLGGGTRKGTSKSFWTFFKR